MAPKIFITGITGYTGGTVFHNLVQTHPEYDVTAYVRMTPQDFEKNYPEVKLIHGTWDDSNILKKAASEADITIQCGNSDHLVAVTALLEGALDGAKQRGTKAYYIHLAGTAIIADFSEEDHKQWRGKLNPKVFNDLDGVQEVTNRPDGVPHRHTDKVILKMGTEYKDVLGTAIVCPPDMYGQGFGSGNSVFVPTFIAEIKRLGYVYYYGEGKNTRGWTHVNDVANVFVRLVEEAVKGGGKATWGKEGYYFTTSQECSQLEMAMEMGKILEEKGVIQDGKPRQVSEDVMDGLMKEGKYADAGLDWLGWYQFGNNSRARSGRAERDLGWAPKEKKLFEVWKGDIERAL